VLRLSDARNFGRTLTGLALIAGPLFLLIAQVLVPGEETDGAARLARIAENKAVYAVSAVLFLLGSLFLLAASVGLIRLFRASRVTLGQLAGALLLIGSAATVAFYTFGAVEYQMATQADINRAEAAKLLDGQEPALAIPILVLFVLGIVLGLILLAVAAWRTGILPLPGAAILAAAGILDFFAEGGVIGIVAFAVTLIGLGWLGLVVLRISDEEWARESPAQAIGERRASSSGDAAAG
jgi:hypothetical protein